MNIVQGFGRLGIAFAAIAISAIAAIVTIEEGWDDFFGVFAFCVVLTFLYFIVFAAVGWLLDEFHDLGAVRNGLVVIGICFALAAAVITILALKHVAPSAVQLGLALMAGLPLVATAAFALPLALLRLLVWVLHGFYEED